MWKVLDHVTKEELEELGYKLQEFDYVANKPYNYVFYAKSIYKGESHGIVSLIEDGLIRVHKCYAYGYEVLDDNDCQFYINDLIRNKMVERIKE